MMLVAVLAALQASGPAAMTITPPTESSTPRVWYTVKVEGTSGPGCEVHRTFTFTRAPGFGRAPQPPQVVWTAERTEKNAFICRGEKHLWIDGRSCPALAQALGEIPDLPTMRFAGPDEGKASGIIFDAPSTSLTAQPFPSQGLQPTITRTEYDGPVARWWRRTDKALERCWQEHPPAA